MFDAKVYVERRRKLIEKMGEGIVLIPNNKEAPMNCAANTYRFRPDSSFSYLFGIDRADVVGVIDVDNEKEYIFGNEYTIDDIIWMGQQETLSSLAEKVGITETFDLGKLDTFIANNINRKVHFLPPYRTDTTLFISNLLGTKHTYIHNDASEKLIQAMVDLRSVKDDLEIAEITKACNAGYQMHTTAMRMCHSGRTEQEIAGAMEGIAISAGGGVSFPIILSQNGQTLHNHKHNGILQKGRLILADAGAELANCYCSDFTRTTPVDGTFTQQQKDIYSIVLKANETVNKLAKPGVLYKKLHLTACQVIAEGLMELGIMKGDAETAVKRGAHALFMPHGLGHMMGMDVHDMENYGEDYVGYDSKLKRSEQFGLAYLRLGRKLEKGFVITNEPGIYFIPELIELWKSEGKLKNFINYDKLDAYMNFGGIRLEDDLLITRTGNQFLGDKRIPITIEDVENTVKEGR